MAPYSGAVGFRRNASCLVVYSTDCCTAFAAFYNDAGLGIDDCGISRLPVLDLPGIAGAAIDCMTCRIGSARSALETGVISKLNKTALRLGLDEGVKVGDAITKISI